LFAQVNVGVLSGYSRVGSQRQIRHGHHLCESRKLDQLLIKRLLDAEL
jgi:hypothetical protein